MEKLFECAPGALASRDPLGIATEFPAPDQRRRAYASVILEYLKDALIASIGGIPYGTALGPGGFDSVFGLHPNLLCIRYRDGLLSVFRDGTFKLQPSELEDLRLLQLTLNGMLTGETKVHRKPLPSGVVPRLTVRSNRGPFHLLDGRNAYHPGGSL